MAASFDYDLGIIGGGAAGLTVAAGAARLGAKTLLLEKETALGGDCLHYGCVPSKTLIKTARIYHTLKNGHRFGLPPVTVEPVDFSRVAERIRNVISRIQQHDSVERFCRLGARVEFGQPEFQDEHAVRINGRSRTAGKWVIATGSSPAIPPVKGLSGVDYLTNREIFSLERLPGSMIVIGGGPVAIEMAQAFRRLGTRVQVVQRGSQILKKEDSDLAEMVAATLAAEGVEFHLGATLEKVYEKNGKKYVVYSTDNGGKASISAEALLVAAGRSPNVEELGLEKAGVEYNRHGVVVDNRLRTSRKNIYAAGDVNGGFMFTHAAGYEGGIVVSNAVFRLPRKTDYTFLPWCTYTSPELASIGMNEKRAAEAKREYSVWSEEFRDNDRSLAEGEETGRLKMLLDRRENPLGVQILGPHAGDLVAEWVAVLNGRVKLSTLAGAIHPYPTLGEINKRVAGTFLSSKLFSDTVRKGLKIFFRLKGRACSPE